MEKNIYGKIKINLLLKIGKVSTGSNYLHFAQNVQGKYGISRWIDKFQTLIYRRMLMLLNEASSYNNGIVKNYTNNIEIYKPVFNLTTNTIVQQYTEIKRQITESYNFLPNVQLDKNIYLRLKREDSSEMNRKESKNSSANEQFKKPIDISNKWLNIVETSIHHSLTNVNLLHNISVKTNKAVSGISVPNFKASTNIPLLKVSVGNFKITPYKSHYIEERQRQIFAKTAEYKVSKAVDRIKHYITPLIIKEQLEVLSPQINYPSIKDFSLDKRHNTEAVMHHYSNLYIEKGILKGRLNPQNTFGNSYLRKVIKPTVNIKEVDSSNQTLSEENIPFRVLMQSSLQSNMLKLALGSGDSNILHSIKEHIEKNRESSYKASEKENDSYKYNGLINTEPVISRYMKPLHKITNKPGIINRRLEHYTNLTAAKEQLNVSSIQNQNKNKNIQQIYFKGKSAANIEQHNLVPVYQEGSKAGYSESRIINSRLEHYTNLTAAKEQLEVSSIQNQHRNIHQMYFKGKFAEDVEWHNLVPAYQEISKAGYSSWQTLLKRNMTVKALRQNNLQFNPVKLTLNSLSQLKDASGFTNGFHIKNTLNPSYSKLISEVYSKEAVKEPSTDIVRVLRRTPEVKTKGNTEIHDEASLILLKPPKSKIMDEKQQQFQEMKPIEREGYTRTSTISKEDRNFKDIGVDEINLLADRVFKVIEKRMEIRKDRRGIR